MKLLFSTIIALLLIGCNASSRKESHSSIQKSHIKSFITLLTEKHPKYKTLDISYDKAATRRYNTGISSNVIILVGKSDPTINENGVLDSPYYLFTVHINEFNKPTLDNLSIVNLSTEQSWNPEYTEQPNKRMVKTGAGSNVE